MSNQDDLYYIDRIIKGESSCFSILIDRYKRQVYTLALRIVKIEEDAEEVSQDAFLKAFKSLKKFKRESSFSSWLYRIVYNTALSRIRKKKLDTSPLEFEDRNFSVDETENAYSKLVANDRKRFLKKALNQLSEEEASLINLFYNGDKTTEEIGTIVGLSHSNVRVKLLRTRKKLLVILNRELSKDVKDIL